MLLPRKESSEVATFYTQASLRIFLFKVAQKLLALKIYLQVKRLTKTPISYNKTSWSFYSELAYFHAN